MSTESLDFANSVTQTWPKSRLANNIASDVKSRVRLANALERARAFIDDDGGGGGGGDAATEETQQLQEARELVSHLYEALERRTPMPTGSTTSIGGGASRRGSVYPSNLAAIREEPHFGSMILCDAEKRISRAGSLASIANPFFRDFPAGARDSTAAAAYAATAGAPLGSTPPLAPSTAAAAAAADAAVDPAATTVVSVEDIYGDLDPFYIRALPHVLLFSLAAAYIFVGALLFQLIDSELNDKTYKEIVLFTYQTCATIGWGDTHVVRPWSRVATVVYATFGVPLTMAAFANMGRLLTEFYCIDWIFLTSVVRGKKPTVQDFANQLPIKGAINLLIGHQLVGLLLFNGLIEDIGIIGSVYFSITSMATIGFGDMQVNHIIEMSKISVYSVVRPSNTFELIVLLSYASSGIIILSALFISISYYVQLIHYGYIAAWLHRVHVFQSTRRAARRRRKTTVAKPPPTTLKKAPLDEP